LSGKITDYIYRQVMPSLAPPIPKVTKGGYSWQKLQSAIEGRPDYFGRERNIPLSIADVLGGVKVNPVDLKQQKQFKTRATRNTIEDLRFKARSIMRNQSLKPEERRREVEKIREKIRNQYRGRK
jgi:hypothetical protein